VDPYLVLVSEAMLQQTQVATVEGYFQRFIQAFPTLNALAEADEQAVLTHWQGLGYYRRARNLHAAARTILDRHGGLVPSTVAALRELPGIGPYSAGAIASLAHGVQAPIVDGNVARVLARLLSLDQPIDRPDGRRSLWSLAQSLVPRASNGINHPGDFNQALMELGATVCTPRDPSCADCPLRTRCRAHASGDPSRWPVKSPPRKPLPVTHHAVALRAPGTREGEHWLIERRAGNGLWAGLWQLPTLEISPGESREISPANLTGWLRERLGIGPGPLRRLAELRHATTHRAVAFVLWGGELRRPPVPPPSTPHPDRRWVPLAGMGEYPMSVPQRRLLQLTAEWAHGERAPAAREGFEGNAPRPRRRSTGNHPRPE
jgi:A/G-specific adenine glycosylase